MIQTIIDKLINRLQEFQYNKKPVRIDLAYNCVTSDVIYEYCFAKNNNSVQNAPEFQTTLHDTIVNIASGASVLKQVPWLVPLMRSAPQRFIALLNPHIMALFKLQDVHLSQYFNTPELI